MTNCKKFKRDAAALLLIIISVLLFFLPVIIRGQRLYLLDVIFQNHPFRAYAFDQLFQGRIPLWCPHIGLGFPLFAEGQSGVFHILNLLFYALLEPISACTWSIIAGFILTACFFYLFLRTWKFDLFPSIAGSLIWALGACFSTKYILTPFFFTALWMPLLLTMIENFMRTGKRTFLFYSGLIVIIQSSAGHPQGLFISLVSSLVYLALCLFRFESNRQTLHRIIFTLFALSLGLTASSFQLLPTMEAAVRSSRQGGMSFQSAASMSFSPANFLCLALPFYYGNPANNTYWRIQDGYFWELAYFPGALVLVLVIAAFFRRTRSAVVFQIFSIVGFVLMLGKYSPLYTLFARLPGISYFRIPARFGILMHFGFAALAAYTLHEITRRTIKKRHLIISSIVVLMVLASILLINKGIFTDHSANLSSKAQIEKYNKIKSGFIRDAASAAFVICSGLIALSLFFRHPRLKIWVSGFILLLILAELLRFSYAFNDFCDPLFFAQPENVSRIKSLQKNGDADYRIYSNVRESNSIFKWHKGWKTDDFSYKELFNCVRMYSGSLFGLNNCSFFGWSPLHPARLRNFAEKLTPAKLNLASVKYVIEPGRQTSEGFQLLYQNYLKLMKNNNRLPWIFSPSRIITRKDIIDFSLDHSSNDSSLRQTITIDCELNENDYRSEKKIVFNKLDYHKPAPNKIIIEPKGEGIGWLFISQMYDPNWKASNGDESIKVFPAEGAMQAIQVIGENQAVLEYKPLSWRLGLFISCFILTLAVILALNLTDKSKALIVDSDIMKRLHLLYFAQLLLLLLFILISIQFSFWKDAFSNIRLDDWIHYRHYLDIL